MRCHRRGWLLVLMSLALAGCEVVEDQLNDVPPPPPPETQPAPAEPAAPSESPAPADGAAAPAEGEQPAPAESEQPAPAEGEAVPTAETPAPVAEAATGEAAAASDDILGAVAAAAEAATAAGDKTATGASATETTDLAEAVAAAGRQSVKDSLLAAERAERRAAAEAELAARRSRQQQYLANAQHHVDYLGLRIKEQDLELATLQCGLLAASLDGVRSQCGPGPAADELAFALGALYDLQTINKEQNAAVANAITHLDAALALLPAPGPAAAAATNLQPGAEQPAKPETAAPANAGEDPGSSPEAMAREVVAIKELFAAGQKRSGRDRLQNLVLAGADDPVEALLELADAARDRLTQAVARRGWSRAAAQLERVKALLSELATAIGSPTPAPVAAAPASGEAAGGRGGLVKLGDEPQSGSGGTAAGVTGEEQER